MINHALIMIQYALDKYIKEVNGINPMDPLEVHIANIARADDATANNLDEIVMSLVNIEEEQTLKNTRHYQVVNQVTEYINPPVNLNLYILFSTNHDDYPFALGRLSDVITFFQNQTVFSLQTTPPPPAAGPLSDFEGIRVNLELYTLTFEQINYLWGSLGGKQVPFVMYRARLVSLQDDRPQGAGPTITDVDGDLGGS